ncbi:MAG: DMT family transporter [Woeseia sp.]
MINKKNDRLSTPRAAYFMLVLTALCLAGNHVIGRTVHDDIPPLGLSFWRWIAGAIMLAPFVAPAIAVRRRVYLAHIGNLAVLGFLIVGSTSAILVALNFTTAVNVSLINAFQPVLTVLLAVLFLGDNVSRAGVAGIVLALAGVLLMVSKASWTRLTGLQFNYGDLIALTAMLGFSVYALNLRGRIPAELSPVESLFAITLTGSLMLLPFYIIESFVYMPVPMSFGTVTAVLALALLVSVLGNLMWNEGNRIVGPSRAAMFINLIPLFGAALAVGFLDERIYWYHAFGAALVCVGIWLIVGKRNAMKEKPQERNPTKF